MTDDGSQPPIEQLATAVHTNSDSRRNNTYGSPRVLVPDTYSFNSSVVTIVFVSFYIPTQKYAASLLLVPHVQQY